MLIILAERGLIFKAKFEGDGFWANYNMENKYFSLFSLFFSIFLYIWKKNNNIEFVVNMGENN